MEIKGYIFDYGGTLDTRGNHWGKVIWHAYERNGVSVTEQRFREAYVFAERKLGSERIIMPDFTFRQTLEAKLQLQLDFLEVQGKLRPLLDDIYSQTLSVVEESREVLRQLNAPKVLVSNFYGNIATVLREFGLADLFQDVIESAVVGIRKPSPQIFILGVEALRKCIGNALLPAENILVVGDSMDKDIIPARQIGCRTAWFKGEPWDDGKTIDEKTTDYLITNLKQLLNYETD